MSKQPNITRTRRGRALPSFKAIHPQTADSAFGCFPPPPALAGNASHWPYLEPPAQERTDHGGCVSSAGPGWRTGDAVHRVAAILPQLLEGAVLQNVDGAAQPDSSPALSSRSSRSNAFLYAPWSFQLEKSEMRYSRTSCPMSLPVSASGSPARRVRCAMLISRVLVMLASMAWARRRIASVSTYPQTALSRS